MNINEVDRIAVILSTLANLEYKDKLYVDKENKLQIDTSSILQGLIRWTRSTLYTECNRISTIANLEQLDLDITIIVDYLVSEMSKPYIQKNYNTFGIISASTSGIVKKTKLISNLLGSCSISLRILTRTYMGDDKIEARLRIIENKFTSMKSSLDNSLKKFL